ncbi:hypothetical protein B0H21DRAFT_691685 [Amylocystis lapponica]|nr:hypothetical protein B0H21DRAFT_691685 [Amylocystis lapponica]
MSLQPSSQLSTPVDRVPPEILIEVFAFSVQAFCSNDFLPLTLGCVSHYWRDVALSSPRVWQHVFLDDRRSIQVLRHQAWLWLLRSNPLPFHVHVNLASVDMLLPLLSPLLPHLFRWRRCTITGVLEQDIDMADLLSGATHVRLQRLQVFVKGVSGLDVPAHHPPAVDNSSDMLTLRSFRSKCLHTLFMRLSVYSLPAPNVMSALQITSLTITETSLEVTTDPVRMLQFLTATPMLESFHFYGWPHEGTGSPGNATPPVVSLPRLRFLLLRSTCAVRTLLSRLHTPALAELYLEHTNVDFVPAHDAYTGLHEDGDSEDEARDFSQSPWSDRATGMGLRTLVHRSKPPLEVLEMDHADMRTKDFRWCFDRLDRLKEFRIVASDMSDTVIGLLAPYRLQSPCIRRDGSIEEDSPLRVRLPMLSSLGLWNCQRLSGDAVVAALKARAVLTDATDAVDVDRLADVAIIACPDFLVHHDTDLSSVLGNRLRTF